MPIFNKGIGMDPSSAGTLGFLQGLQGLDQAGFRRTAGPMGSIAQNLMPLLQAMAQARAAQSEAILNQFLVQAQLMKSGGDPEERAAKIQHLKSLAASEQALAEERAGKGKYREQQQQLIERILGGQGGGATAGLKPSITYGSGGPSVSFKSDILSPEALQQRKEIQAAGAGVQLQKGMDLAQFKEGLTRSRPPKPTQAQINALEAGDVLMSMLDQVPAAIETIPRGYGNDRAGFAKQAGKYQLRAEHPAAANLITGLTGGLASADTDPNLDTYFSTVGQVQAALASFNLVGMRGGFKTLQWLQAHFPGYADTPQEALNKAKFLRSNSGIVKQKVDYLRNLINNSATVAGQVGGQAVGDRVRVKVRGPNGQEAYIMIDPETGATSVPEEGETSAAPQ